MSFRISFITISSKNHREKKIEVQTQIFLLWAGQSGQMFLADFGQSKDITDGSTFL